MGGTPSLAYVMHGKPEHPSGESWGGTFTPITATFPIQSYSSASNKEQKP